MGMEPVAASPLSEQASDNHFSNNYTPKQHKKAASENFILSNGNGKRTPSTLHSVAVTPSPSPAPTSVRTLSPPLSRRKSTGSRESNRQASLPSRPSLDGKPFRTRDGSTPQKKTMLSSSDDDDEGRLRQGPWFLKLAKSYHSQGDNPAKAFQFAQRAVQCFEKSVDGKASLELVVSLHILAALHCRMGQFEEAVTALKRALEIPNPESGMDHVLATFSGNMQMGDTLALMGKHQLSLASYHAGLQIQKNSLGELDPRVGETCRYIAEAHLQAMQFDEAQELCELALKIHQEKSTGGTVEEAADRRLMAMVCSGKEDHEAALEHLLLSSTLLLANGLESDVAAVDATIGDALLALGRDTEAALSYQKAVTVFKATKGENHALVASVYVKLSELYMKTGKPREAKTFCESALRILGTHAAGHSVEDLVYGLADVAGIYEMMGEKEKAIELLSRAVALQGSAPGQHFTTAGIEAQLGIVLYMVGKYQQAHSSIRNSVAKLKATNDGKASNFLGMLMNQLGLACIELSEIDEACATLQEAKSIMEEACGPLHSDTLAVCSNLASTYDALGRTHEAINMLETILDVKEDRLGTIHPEVEDERDRLAVLMNEMGRSRMRKSNTLEELLTMAKFETARH
ncbi:hypothetical protein R1sor_005388 [Riccia sorocarpa]|uniref:Kinesin light chain n=1 Tax=Riccia sorocarpa TaxID=122646 RepID=A0ABD3HMX2_9MARC